MDAMTRIEQAMQVALGTTGGSPPRLAAALRYAVFPGGARVRPRLCLSVAGACGGHDPAAAEAAAVAIELLHCASLVHDDMPCFDDAAMRRGKPSVHRAFGENLALLTGDALIVLAFQTLGQGASGEGAGRLGALLAIVAGAAGMPFGIVAGQAWECEPQADLAVYQRAKTAALFAAAAAAGAAAGAPAGEAMVAGWQRFGEHLGEAYQVADDIRDVLARPEEMGKPAGQDHHLGRPSAVAAFGARGALLRLKGLVASAIGAIPPCPGAGDLRGLILLEVQRLLPDDISRRAA